jgi:uncharacterized protein YggT (Ycf19 family)
MFTTRLLQVLTAFIFTFIEVLLSLRIILKFLGANTVAPFVTWVYDTSQPLLAPFEGMFPTIQLEGPYTIEIATLFALVVYAFVGFFAEELLRSVENLSAKRRNE